MGTALAAYILVWPLISAIVLLIICRAFVIDLRQARAKDRDMV